MEDITKALALKVDILAWQQWAICIQHSMWLDLFSHSLETSQHVAGLLVNPSYDLRVQKDKISSSMINTALFLV